MEEPNNQESEIEDNNVLEKPKKPRTKAQEVAFLRAKEKRLENIKQRKEQIMPLKEKIQKINMTKPLSATPKVVEPELPPTTSNKSKQKPKAKYVPLEESESESESDEDEIVIVKKKPKKKNKKVVYLEESDDEEEYTRPMKSRPHYIQPSVPQYHIKFV